MSEGTIEQVERYRGSLLGLAVGDALGTTLEFAPPGSFEPLEDMVGGGPFGLAPGEWTDDTAMALCLAESLLESGGFDPLDQMRRYVRWYREGYMSSTGECFDIGGATMEALERFEEEGEPYSGSDDPRKAGNGSIMRLAPVPLFYARAPLYPYDASRPLEAVERSGDSSRTTHGASTAVDACCYLGGLIAGAANGVDKEELLSERYSPNLLDYWRERPLSPEVDEVAAGSFKDREPPRIEGSGYVVRSLEAALWAFHNSGSFREGALLAVNLGDDADTTGAVYGQLAGAFYGEREIPEEWLRPLASRPLIERLAEALYRAGPRVDWSGPLSFLPAFERPGFVPTRAVVPEDLPPGHFGGYWIDAPEVKGFRRAVNEAGAYLPFRWLGWVEEAGRLFEEPGALATADEPDLRKLLYLHGRRERFAEGHYARMIESGHIAAIVRRAAELSRV